MGEKEAKIWMVFNWKILNENEIERGSEYNYRHVLQMQNNFIPTNTQVTICLNHFFHVQAYLNTQPHVIPMLDLLEFVREVECVQWYAPQPTWDTFCVYLIRIQFFFTLSFHANKIL